MRNSWRLASSTAWKGEAGSVPYVLCLEGEAFVEKGDFISKFQVPLIMPWVYFYFHLLSSNLAVIQGLVSSSRLL